MTQPYRVIESVVRLADREARTPLSVTLPGGEHASALRWILAASRVKVAFASGSTACLLALGCRLERRGVRRIHIQTWDRPLSRFR